MSRKKQFWFRLAVTSVALGLHAGAGWLLGLDDLRHYHETNAERHAHSHLHSGAHRHDHHHHGSHEPEHDDAYEGRYVPAACTAVVQAVVISPPGTLLEDKGCLTPAASSKPESHGVDSTASPRGPPA
jgi:hypothetical protein